VKWPAPILAGRAAFAGERIGGCGERRRELARSEGVQGAEASSELDGGQAALTVEPAEEIRGRALPFLGVAFEATRDEVAAGSAAATGERHYVVETPNEGRGPPLTIKASAALARMDGQAQGLTLEKIRRLVRGRARPRSRAASRANLAGQAHLDQVTSPAALHQAQHAPREEAAQRIARGPGGEPHTTCQPGNGEAQARAAFQVAMAEQVRIDGTLCDGQAQPRDEKILELFPDLFGVGFFVFHGSGPEHAGAGVPAAKGDLGRPEREVDSRQLTVKREDKDLTQTRALPAMAISR